MAKGEENIRRPWEVAPPDEGKADRQGLKPSEELVAEAGRRDVEVELTAQLEQAREEEAFYETRYGMTFEEYQATMDPEATHDVGENYLAWSRAAERVRMLRYELARLTEKPARRPRPASRANDERNRGGPKLS